MSGAPEATIAMANLVGVRAALAAGASPGAALAEAGDGPLVSVSNAVRLGRTVTEEAAEVDTGDLGADLLVRALGVAEQAGVGAGAAVAQALRALRDGLAMEQLLEVRTAQARMSATMLAVIPAVAWLLLLAADPSAARFYATPLGVVTGCAALGAAAAGRWWSGRLVRRARRAGADADPLAPARPSPQVGRALAVGLPILVTLTVARGPLLGLLVAVPVAVALMRPRGGRTARDAPDTSGGGAAEATELVSVALAAGMPTVAAVETVAPLAPPAAQAPLRDAARRLRGGWDAQTAFEGTGLDGLGRVLATADRWGAPSAEALRELAKDLRSARHAAAEAAAERVQVALIFPTTLLTLPSFVLAVVPPLLWTGLSSGVGLT